MRLLIDLGNTRLKWRRWKAGSLLPASAGHGLDDLAMEIRQRDLRQAHIAAVARPAIRAELKERLDGLGVSQDWLVTPARGLNLVNSYAQPHKLGIDRWLALAAAYAEHRTACCVIDIGTAITVDVCDARGKHQGGLIAPGLQALRAALSQGTGLPPANAELPAELLWAQDTEKALGLGALHSACALVERSIQLARTHQGCDTILLTGGGAETIARYLEASWPIDHELVFKGLALHAAEQQVRTA